MSAYVSIRQHTDTAAPGTEVPNVAYECLFALKEALRQPLFFPFFSERATVVCVAMRISA
jgi:hypothetical protein